MFKKGQSGNPKGQPKGAKLPGRPPDWLKAECRKHAPDIIKFLVSVAKGEDVEQAVGDQGETIRIPPAVRDRIRASEMLLDRGFGKVEQGIQVSGDDTRPVEFREFNGEIVKHLKELASRVIAENSGAGSVLA